MQESNYNIVIIFLIALCLISCGSTNIGLNTKEDFQSESRKNFYPVTGMWESMAGPPGGGYFNSLVQNPYNHKELYAHSQEIVFHTMDGGESWTILKDLKNIHINKIVPYRDRLFICGDGLHEYTKEGGLVNILKLECANIFISDDKLLVLPYLYPDGRDEILLLSLLIEGYNMQKILIPKNFLSYFNISNQSSHKDTWIECNDVIISGENILMALTAKFGESEEQDQSRIFLTENLGENWKLMDVPLVHRSGVSRLIKDKDDESCIYLLIAHNLIHDLISPLSEMVYRSFDMGKSWESFIEIDIDANGPLNLIKRDKAYYILDPKGAGIIKFTGDECEIVDCPRIDYWNEISFQIDTLYFDNTNPDVVYAKTDSIWALGLIKSEDGMNTWKKMDTDIIRTSPTIIAPHPDNPEIVFTNGNIMQESYMTPDFGNTWVPFSPVAAGDEVAIDPHNTNHILLVDENTEIYESMDMGKSFESINNGFYAARIFDFEISPDGSGKTYVSNLGVGISYSDMAFVDNWRYMLHSPDYTYDLELDPVNPSEIYATYSPKLFEDYSAIWHYSPEQDENFGWKELAHFENTDGISNLVIDKQDPNKLYAGVIGEHGNIYLSTDKGNTWSELNPHLTFSTIHAMTSDSTNNNICYAAPWGGGLYKTQNSGASWVKLTVPTISIASIVIDKHDPSHLFVGDRTKPGVYESNDGGITWKEYINFDNKKYYRVMAMAMHGDALYVSCIDKMSGMIALYQKGMSGTTFKIKEGKKTIVNNGLSRSIISFFSDEDSLYGITHIEGVFKLDGNNWHKITSGLPDMGFNSGFVKGNSLYVIGGCDVSLSGTHRLNNQEKVNQIYKSNDNGLSWTPIIRNNTFSQGIKQFVIHPDYENLFIIATGNGVWTKTDNSTDWKQQNAGLLFKNIAGICLVDNTLYAGTLGGGVYAGQIDRTGDISWNVSNGPYPEIYNIQIDIDPKESNIVYASAYPGGVFKTTDKGKSWLECNFALPSFEVTDPITQGYYSLEIDPHNTQVLYLGIFGKGIYKSYNGGAVWFPMYGKRGQNHEIMQMGIRQLVADPWKEDTLYMAANTGIFQSSDGAENWIELTKDSEVSDILSLRLYSYDIDSFHYDFSQNWDPAWESEGGWSLDREAGNGVLKGEGHNWININNLLGPDYRFRFKMKIAKSAIHINFYLSESGRYYINCDENGFNAFSKQYENRKTHKGLMRTHKSLDLTQWNNYEVEILQDTITFSINNTKMFTFTDPEILAYGGVAFESLDNSEIYIDDLEGIPLSRDTFLYAGTAGYGIYSYSCKNRKWHNSGRTLGNGWWNAWDRRMYQFSSLLFDPDIPGRVYLGHFPGGFFVSEDNGHTWKDSSLGIGNDGIFSLTMHPVNHDEIWVGTYNGVMQSTDKGYTWQLKSNGMPSEQWPFSVTIDDENPSIMYTATKNGQNQGFCNRNSFCGVVMKSTGSGNNWFKIMNGLNEKSEFYDIIIYPLNHNILFLSSNKGVYLSKDAGETWTTINSGLPVTYNQVRDNVAQNLALTEDNNHLILGLMGHGVWKLPIAKLDLPK